MDAEPRFQEDSTDGIPLYWQITGGTIQDPVITCNCFTHFPLSVRHAMP